MIRKHTHLFEFRKEIFFCCAANDYYYYYDYNYIQFFAPLLNFFLVNL